MTHATKMRLFDVTSHSLYLALENDYAVMFSEAIDLAIQWIGIRTATQSQQEL